MSTKNEHTWGMRHEGSKVLEEMKLTDCRYELAGKVYDAMEKLRVEAPALPTYWHTRDGTVCLKDMPRGHLVKRLSALVAEINDPTAERTLYSTLDFAQKFIAELQRRDEEEQERAASKSRIDYATIPAYTSIHWTPVV